MRLLFTALLAGAAAAAVPAGAVTNLIVNGSFEDGFSGFTYSSQSSESNPAVVILYNNPAAYGTNGGAYGEAVPTNPLASPGGDAAGTHAAYFVDDGAVNETIAQRTKLAVGHYEVGFSAYLPYNGAANGGDATFVGKILNATVADFTASSTSAGTWVTYSGVADITKAGYYTTSFVYNTFNVGAAKDVVIDQVYAVKTNAPATVEVPPTTSVPEAATWVLMIAGFGLVGTSLRRRNANIVAA
jgi:hypothetical protein